MRNVPCKLLNLAHQLKQGTKCANLPCSMIGYGCNHEEDAEIWQVVRLNGEMLFGCEIASSSWAHARKYSPGMELSELVG